MQIIDNKALQYKLRNPAPILAAIPESRLIDENTVWVKWDLPQVQTLRALNYEAPSPIIGRYDWPGKYKPFDHQRTTAEFLTLNKRAFCFSEPGTGKTGSAIWAADYLMNRGLVKRALIVCPVSIMDAAWRSDLFNFAMHRKVDIAHGAAAKRRKIIASDAEFVIINFDGLGVVEDEIAAGGFDLIVVDEASSYQNSQTKRWETLNKLVTDDTWLWMMTGTPAAQGPDNAYGLAKLVNPRGVPKFFGKFRDEVMIKTSPFKWAPKQNASETVHRVLQPAIRFTKDECLDLPEMLYVKRHVELTKQQQVYYDRIRKDKTMRAAGEDITAVNAAVLMTKLLQVACGAAYSDDSNTLQFDISSRYKVLKEVIDETPNKVLVFVPFQNTIEILTQKLKNDGVAAEIISGSVKAGDRTDIFRRFQTETNPKVLVIQPQAAAHGVTLTAADTVVWWGPTPSLEIYAQANARIHRSGQVNRCTVVQLEGSPVERRYYALLDAKIDVHSKMIDLYKGTLD